MVSTSMTPMSTTDMADPTPKLKVLKVSRRISVDGTSAAGPGSLPSIT